MNHARLLGADDHGRVVGLGERADDLHLEVAQQHAPDGLDLQVREHLSHAAVAASTETEVRERLLLVLLTRRREAVRVELVRVGEDRRQAVANGWRHEERITLRERERVSVSESPAMHVWL